MTAWSFIRRGIWHYRVAYLGVLAGAVLGATVLLGALLAGSSVKGTLRVVAENRIGQVDHLFVAGEGFFREQLAGEVSDGKVLAAPLLFLKGQVNAKERGVGNVQIVGVDDSFWRMAPDPATHLELADREVAVNAHLAASLGLEAGDSVVLRLQEPGKLSRDAPLSGEAEDVISFRADVRELVGDSRFGRFSLEASQLPVATVFVPIKRLQEVIEFPGKANMLLLDTGGGDADPEGLAAQIREAMVLEDYGLSLVDIPLAESTEIRSDRIFLEKEIVTAVEARFPETRRVVSYLANTLAAKGKETPYSMVTGTDPAAAPFLPADLQAGEVVINSWLAEDLGAGEGDELTISYFQLAEGNRLNETSRSLRVRTIVPLEGLAADRLWMPDFPGVAEAEDAQEWTPGLPLDLERIRQKDEDYWDDYRGTPKAFVSAEAGMEFFGNRWGDFTSLRIPLSHASRDEVASGLLQIVEPAMAGLLLRDLRNDALSAAKSPVDIAGLFLSMSFFLIVASVSLTAMLFRFNVEQRNTESGLLAALGVRSRKVMRWRLGEALVIVTLGSILGLGLAIVYSLGILRFLETIWSEGSSESLFAFHMDAGSVAGGVVGFIALSMLAVWLTVRKQARKSASLRLEAGTEEVQRGGGKVRNLVVAEVICIVLGVGCLLAKDALSPQLAFFFSGMFLLVGGLLNYRAWLAWSGNRRQSSITPRSLATLNNGRRPTRSMVVVGTLACGVFMLIAVTAFRKHGGDEWRERGSGAGGYAFWIETTNPINRAADANEDPDYFELGDARGRLGGILPFRMGVGDDASCFNLNKAARPRLLATDVGVLAERGAFTLNKVADGLDAARGWELLREPAGERRLRAFIDQTTLQWVLMMKVGDLITYTDEKGRDFEVELAGTLADSVFQGSLLVDEAALLEFFPSQEGYRLFLAETEGDLEETRTMLQKATADRGSTVTTTRERLEAFHGVENTYIAIFHVLGGLGLILGSAGIGIVTARNLAERQTEFRILRTVGIPERITRSVIFREVRTFIGSALLIGLAAAVIAILPALAGTPPVKTLIGFVILVVAIALNSLGWAWVGYRVGYRRGSAFGG